MPNKQGHETSSVFVALVGRPNVGKSSLTNQLVGEKVAIVTNKPQTTRSRITGVITKGPVQYVLMDTPGIHLPRNKLDARMTQTAAASVKDVDVTVMLFEPAGTFTESEQTMMDALRKSGPALAVINKVDTLRGFEELEARRQEIARLGIFEEVLTVSAKDGTGCDALLEKLKTYATPGPHYFDDDAFTDMPEKELVAELIREKLLLFMREEIPHGVAVTVQSFKERPDRDLVDISVEICCERKNHKGMIIGKNGQMLKKIATAARLDCEELLGVQVNLQCWVKVREGWRDNACWTIWGSPNPERIAPPRLDNFSARGVVHCLPTKKRGGRPAGGRLRVGERCRIMPQDSDSIRDGCWAQFVQTGSVYDYLDYKSKQAEAVAKEGDVHAACHKRPGSPAGQGGGGRSDPDDPHA